MKKISLIVLCIIIMSSNFLMGACSNNKSKSGTEQSIGQFETKEYVDNQEFFFFADLPPVINSEQLDIYSKAGFNGYVLIPWSSYNAEFNGTQQLQFKNALNLLQEKNIGALVRGFENKHDSLSMYGDNGCDLTEFPAFKGFYITDEPSADKFDNLSKNFVPYWNEVYADKGAIWHLNMYPSYANDGLGTKYDSINKRSAYQVYIDEYVEKVLSKVNGKKYMCMDHYPLNVSNGKNILSSMFLYDLVVSADGAKRANASFGTCIQAYSSLKEGRRIFTSSNESKFLFNTAVTLGADLFEVFCYESFDIGGHYSAMIDNGLTNMYYYVQEAITELKKYDHVLMSFKHEGFKTVEGSEESYTESGFGLVENFELEKLTGLEVSSTHDMLIGQFDDDGIKGYMAVNYTDPAKMKSNTVRFTFDNSKKAVVYRNGNPIKYLLPKKTLELTLLPGEAVYVVQS